MTDLPYATELQAVFPGDSAMARLLRAFDWSQSELGAPTSWPENLRTAVRLCLTSRLPILLWWGQRQCVLYNDALVPFLGERGRPHALTRPGCELWGDIWETIGPMLASVVATGTATGSDDVELFFDRGVAQEEAF